MSVSSSVDPTPLSHPSPLPPGNYINKSLLALGHVIQKLSEASNRASIRGGGEAATHVPFRCVGPRKT